MKIKKLLLIITLLASFITFGQNFKYFEKTDAFYMTQIDSLTAEKHWKNMLEEKQTEPASIYLKNKKGQNLYEIKITDPAYYYGTSVEVLEINDLENVVEIIRLESIYEACCTESYMTYFLKTKEGILIKLPEIDNLHCDRPEPIFEYRFPDQKFGIENQIIFAKSSINEKYEVESIEIHRIYSWDAKMMKFK